MTIRPKDSLVYHFNEAVLEFNLKDGMIESMQIMFPISTIKLCVFSLSRNPALMTNHQELVNKTYICSNYFSFCKHSSGHKHGSYMLQRLPCCSRHTQLIVQMQLQWIDVFTETGKYSTSRESKFVSWTKATTDPSIYILLARFPSGCFFSSHLVKSKHLPRVTVCNNSAFVSPSVHAFVPLSFGYCAHFIPSINPQNKSTVKMLFKSY